VIVHIETSRVGLAMTGRVVHQEMARTGIRLDQRHLPYTLGVLTAMRDAAALAGFPSIGYDRSMAEREICDADRHSD
jgi:hypothetical protein